MSLQLVKTTIYPGNEWVRAVALMPKVDKFKFVDAFAGTVREMKILCVRYNTNMPVDFNHLERDISQTVFLKIFKKVEAIFFGIEYTDDPVKTIWTQRTLDSYELQGIKLPTTSEDSHKQKIWNSIWFSNFCRPTKWAN